MVTSKTANVDLVKLFGTVAKAMSQNQTSMNEADTYNHDHGDNMVQIFEVITQAMKEKKSASPADQLAYASEILRKKSNSGSAQIYSEGLKDAAQQFTGKKTINLENAMQLVQLLLGSAGGSTGSSGSIGGDLLGSLLNNLGGQQSGSGQQSGIDLGDILNVGMTLLQNKQSGGSGLDSILGTLVSSSKVGSEDYRAQSGTLVANTLINAISQMAKTK